MCTLIILFISDHTHYNTPYKKKKKFYVYIKLFLIAKLLIHSVLIIVHLQLRCNSDMCDFGLFCNSDV